MVKNKKTFNVDSCMKSCTNSVAAQLSMIIITLLIELFIIRYNTLSNVSINSVNSILRGFMTGNVLYIACSMFIYPLAGWYHTVNFIVYAITYRKIKIRQIIAHILFIFTYIADVYVLTHMKSIMSIKI